MPPLARKTSSQCPHVAIITSRRGEWPSSPSFAHPRIYGQARRTLVSVSGGPLNIPPREVVDARCPDAATLLRRVAALEACSIPPRIAESRERTGQIRQNYPLEAMASVTHSAVVTTLRMSNAILLTRRVRLTWPDLAYDQLPTDGYRRLVPPAITKGCGDVYVLIGSAKGLFGHYSGARIHCKALGPMRVGTDPT